MNSGLFILVLFILLTISVFIFIRLYRRRQAYQQLDKEISDTLNKWLRNKVCYQCDLTSGDLDKKALNRISGAALRAAKPLREMHNVQIELPKIGRALGGPWKDFSININMKEIQPFLKSTQNK